MGICLVLGFVAYRRTSNLADYILGGRSLGSWVTAFSAQASDMSGWLLMGLPGLAYLAGFDAVWLAAGLILGTWLNWRFIAAPLRIRTEQLGDALTHARLLRAPLRRPLAHPAHVDRAVHPGVLHLLRQLGLRRDRPAVRVAVRHALPRRHGLGQRRHARLHVLRRLPRGELVRRAAGHADVLRADPRGGDRRRARRRRRRAAGTHRGRESRAARSAGRQRRPGARADRHRLAAGVGPRLSGPAAHPGALHGDPFGGGHADGTARGDGVGDRGAARRGGGRSRGRGADRAAAAGAGRREGVHPDGDHAPASGAGRHLPVGDPRRDHEHGVGAVAGRLVGVRAGLLQGPVPPRSRPRGVAVGRPRCGARHRAARLPARAQSREQGARPRGLGLGRLWRGVRPGHRAVAVLAAHDAQRRARRHARRRAHRDPVEAGQRRNLRAVRNGAGRGAVDARDLDREPRANGDILGFQR